MATVVVSGADVGGQNFTDINVYSISGTISGLQATGVTVTLGGASSATTTSDGAGHYSFTGLANGSYTVTPSLSGGYGFSPVDHAVVVSGADVSGQDFTDTGLYKLSGTVSGLAKAGLTIALRGARSPVVGSRMARELTSSPGCRMEATPSRPPRRAATCSRRLNAPVR